MDIKKLTSDLKGTQVSQQSNRSSEVRSPTRDHPDKPDKISPGGYQFRTDEAHFARTELQKHSRAAFGKVREMSAEIDAFEKAKKDPNKDPADTRVGRMLSDADVMEKIARRILEG